MPTKNPKVSGYVPQFLKDRLIQFQEDNDGVSESKALTIILTEYFGLQHQLEKVSEGVSVGGVTLAEFDALRLEVDKLKEKVNHLSSEKSSLLLHEGGQDRSSEPLQLKVDVDVQSERFSPISGLKLSEFRFGMNKSSVSGAKKAKSIQEFTKWTKSKDPDGIAWKSVEKPVKGYVPVGELSSELQIKLKKWIEENI